MADGFARNGFARINNKPQCVVSVHSPLSRSGGDLNLLLKDCPL